MILTEVWKLHLSLESSSFVIQFWHSKQNKLEMEAIACKVLA